MTRIIIGTILVLVGISALFGISLFNFAFALILIAIGVRILSGKRRNDWKWESSRHSSTNDDFLNEVAVFSPLNKTVKSENFKGGKVVMIFASGEIDISQATTTEKIVSMEIVAVFGGAKLIVPRNWKINSQGTAIFGGYNNKVESGNGDVMLNLKGAAIFGGVEIVN